MPKDYKLLTGRHIIGYGSPVLIAAINFSKRSRYFTENGFFLPDKKVFKYRRFSVDYDPSEIPEGTIKPEAVLANEIQVAQNTFEEYLNEKSHELYMSLFWCGQRYEFREPTSDPLIMFQLRGEFKDALGMLSEKSTCDELREHLQDVIQYPSFTIKTLD